MVHVIMKTGAVRRLRPDRGGRRRLRLGHPPDAPQVLHRGPARAAAIHMLIVYSAILKVLDEDRRPAVLSGLPARPVGRVLLVVEQRHAAGDAWNAWTKNLGVPPRHRSFTLSVGASINMDGTALYQGVAAVFMAQIYGIDLDFVQQLTIVLTATLASIGTVGIPGAGIVMLAIVLDSVGVPLQGIGIILGVDRFWTCAARW